VVERDLLPVMNGVAANTTDSPGDAPHQARDKIDSGLRGGTANQDEVDSARKALMVRKIPRASALCLAALQAD